VDMNNLDENVLNRDQKIAVYRIVQEQLNNILKYANASRVSIQLKNESGRIRLDIADDGDGFDPKAKRKGIGITNIISRAELYNGHVQIDSEPGKGCRLGVTLNVKS
jgi:two-component system, NarL family, sensor histidine kinase UhpB